MQRSANATIRAQRIQQDARAAAAAALAIPNGLKPGGLVVDPGVAAGIVKWEGADAPVERAGGLGTEVYIKQNEAKAILNWESFNVGAKTTVNFDQSAGNTVQDPAGAKEWIALNRVNNPEARPSEIHGQIKADGQVYIIDRNGIMFGATGQVNTRGLVASSLALRDEQFMAGINQGYSPINGGIYNNAIVAPQFGESTTIAGDQNFVPAYIPKDVVIEAGAQIDITDGGKAIILAPHVTNRGTITAQNGQVILAAGEQVWLRTFRGSAEDSPETDLARLHGFEVGVSAAARRYNDTDYMLERAGELDFRVVNEGIVGVTQGNITLQSRTVEQLGVLTTTTALNNNSGTILLRAWYNGTWQGGAGESAGLEHPHAGTVTFGPNSLTALLPDADTSEIELSALETRYTQGQIEVRGALLDFQAGSVTMAPGQKISLVASSKPPAYGSWDEEPNSMTPTGDGARIYVDQDAILSVAGMTGVLAPMSRNEVRVELFINELRDSVLQKDGPLYRKRDIYVDRRASGVFDPDSAMAGVTWLGTDRPGEWVGTPYADVSGWLGNGQTTIQEITASGGEIAILSTGDFISRPGSIIDISGGSFQYESGTIRTSRLIGLDGRLYDISEASPELLYQGLAGTFTRTSERWGVSETWTMPLIGSGFRFENGYTEGRSAGSVQILAASNIVMEGSIFGDVILGDRQSQGPSPIGEGDFNAGSLTIGSGSAEGRSFSPDHLIITASPTLLAADFAADAPVPDNFAVLSEEGGRQAVTWLSDSLLSDSGLGSVAISMQDGDFTLAADANITMRPGASFSVIRNENSPTNVELAGAIDISGGTIRISGLDVHLADTVRLDVSGDWINERVSGVPTGGYAIDGGSLTLEGWTGLSADVGASIDASGGGYLGVYDLVPTGGDAGSIQLLGATGELLRNIDMRALAMGNGGAITIATSTPLQIGGTLAEGDLDTMLLSASYFDDLAALGFSTIGFQGGFQQSRAGSLTVADDVVISPRAQGLLAVDGFLTAPTGSSILDFTTQGELPLAMQLERSPMSVALTGSEVTIGRGAVIDAGLRGVIALNGGNVTVNGTLTVAGSSAADNGLITIRHGGGTLPAGNILINDGARLIARGAAATYVDKNGLTAGRMLDGGHILLDGGIAQLVAPDAVLDVSGTQGLLSPRARDGSVPEPVLVASNGGSITVGGAASNFIEGKMFAQAGGASALGGSFNFVGAASSGDDGGEIWNGIPNNVAYQNPDGSFTTLNILTASRQGRNIDLAGIYDTPVVITNAELQALRGFSLSTNGGVVLTAEGLSLPSDGSLPTAEVSIRDAIQLSDPRVFDIIANHLYLNDRETKIVLPVAVGLQSIVSTKGIENAGFSAIQLGNSQGTLTVNDGVALSAARSIALNYTLVNGGGSARFEAPLITLRGFGTPTAETATGTLDLVARQIDVTSFSTAGYEHVRLQADEGLRFLAINDQGTQVSNLTVDHDLTITAGQVHPATGVDAVITAGGTLTTAGTTAQALPLSAGGSLTVNAPRIDHGGVFTAPLGTITLNAAEELILRPGSLVSVKADSVIPYGWLLNNEDWYYDPANQIPAALKAPPEKQITLSAPNVLLEDGAVVDISGGGDLHAWEFVTGPGGSHDILALNGFYAIMPGYASGVAPKGRIESNDTLVDVGDRVWIDSVPGLDAGYYTLLPAHYALLPGAFAVQSLGGGKSVGIATDGGPQGYTNGAGPDGSWIRAGYRVDGLSGAQDQWYSAWRIMTGDTLRLYSEYNEATANEFFSSDAFLRTQYRVTGQNIVIPPLARDGGRVAFKATDTLVLDGKLNSQAVDDGRGGTVDIAGAKIAVLGAGRDAEPLKAEGYLVIDASTLSSFGASSLLLGGTRSSDPEGTRVEVLASDILIANDAQSAMVGPEIILAAANLVDVREGSVLAAEGNIASTGDLLIAPQVAAVYSDPDGWDDGDLSDDILVTPASDTGALLRLSNGGAVSVRREGASADAGRLSIGADARLDGGAALLMDATGIALLGDGAALAGESVSLSSGRVGIGGGDSTTTLVLSEDVLGQLGQSSDLTLVSYSTFDIYGAAVLGHDGLNSLTLDGAGLVSYGAQGAELRGQTVRLINTSASLDGASAGTGNGTLLVAAGDIVLGKGDKALIGFGDVTLQAKRLLGEGAGTLDAGSAAMLAEIGTLAGEAGSTQAVRTSGAMTIGAQGTSTDEDAEDGSGVGFAFAGSTLDFGGAVRLSGGSLSLTASSGDLTVAPDAIIDVSGVSKAFHDVTEYSDAGRIDLVAAGGSVKLGAGSVLDLSASGSGDAGRLSITADGGMADLAGTLLAGHEDGRGGAFALDSSTIADFAALSTMLNEAGFDAARDFRVRQGDIRIGGETKAERFSIRTDEGDIVFEGRIDARATFGGTIDAVAGGDLVITQGAELLAGAVKDYSGGRVTLEALGTLRGEGGTIDLTGGSDGRVRLRAARNGGNNDLAISTLATTIKGTRAGQIVVEGVKRYDASGDFAGAYAATVTDANVFAGNANAIRARLGRSDLTVAPGIELYSTGDLLVADSLNLFADLVASRHGTLTLRAAGNLAITGNINDGFDTPELTGALQAGESWNLRLVAGADLTAGDALSVRSAAALGDAGNILIGDADTATVVRTGTGDIDLRAGNGIDLLHHRAALYTAGMADNTPIVGFTPLPDGSNPVFSRYGGQIDASANGAIQAKPGDALMMEWLYRRGSLGDGKSNFVPEYSNTTQYLFGPEGSTQEYYQDGVYYGSCVIGSGGYCYIDVQVPTGVGVQTHWWVNPAGFAQGFGALGGGNLIVNAGGDISNLMAVVASNGRVSGGRTDDEARQLHVWNGGALSVDAGGSIRAGQYYTARGDATIKASALTTGRTLQAVRDEGWQVVPLGTFDIAPILALGDGALSVSTAGEMTVQSVIEPFLMAHLDRGDETRRTEMFNTTDRTSLRLASTGGDIELVGQVAYLAGVNGVARIGWGMPIAGYDDAGNYLPAHSSLIAFDGSVTLAQANQYQHTIIPMIPSAMINAPAFELAWLDNTNPFNIQVRGTISSDLRILANDDIALGTLAMAKGSWDLLPTAFTPWGAGARYAAQGARLRDSRETYDFSDRVANQPNDTQASRFYAMNGTIRGLGVRQSAQIPGTTTLISNEAVWFQAGQDILNVQANLRNNHATDVSWFRAGNDILALTANVQGPGAVMLEAGRDIWFPQSFQATYSGGQGIQTIGNYTQIGVFDSTNTEGPFTQSGVPTRDGAIPEQGAEIVMMAGMKDGADYAAFAAAYLDPANVGSMPEWRIDAATGLPIYFLTTTEDRDGTDKIINRGLGGFLAELSGTPLTDEQRANPKAHADQWWADFSALPGLTQRRFLNYIFTQELREAGRNQLQPGNTADGLPLNGGYNRGYSAIDVLFPKATEWSGDLIMDSNRLATWAGGDIYVIAPGGGVQVASLARNDIPAGNGIVTRGPGDIRMFTRDSVTVNSSRILTFEGGDVMIWSTLEDIDAGRGKKSSRSSQRPVWETDVDGNTMLVEKGPVSGSGIGTVRGIRSAGEGDVDLVAPEGTVNAGDAGIRVTGNITVAAQQVIGADNIDVEGESIGIPQVEAVDVSLNLDASNAAASAAQAAAQAGGRNNPNRPLTVTVTIEGFGDEKCPNGMCR